MDLNKIRYRELTVEEIRQTMKAVENRPVDYISMLFPDKLPGHVISLATGISIKELEKLPPSDIAHIQEKVCELNDFFLSMLNRLARIGRTASQAIDPESEK